MMYVILLVLYQDDGTTDDRNISIMIFLPNAIRNVTVVIPFIAISFLSISSVYPNRNDGHSLLE